VSMKANRKMVYLSVCLLLAVAATAAYFLMQGGSGGVSGASQAPRAKTSQDTRNATSMSITNTAIPRINDPTGFWRKDDVVWLNKDIEARLFAKRLVYPPPAFPDSEIDSQVYETVESNGAWDPNSPGYPTMHMDRRSQAFWTKWNRILPEPPESIEREQTLLVGVAQSVRERKLRYTGDDSSRAKRELRGIDNRISEARSTLYTNTRCSEALTDDVISALADGKRGDGVHLAWRTKYLKRLISEGVDPKYIEAYKKEWGMTNVSF
jgi:hypothetical protein